MRDEERIKDTKYEQYEITKQELCLFSDAE